MILTLLDFVCSLKQPEKAEIAISCIQVSFPYRPINLKR